jgi:hypothetical protein
MASLVLLSGLMMAQPSTNKADKNKSSQHHSKLAKLAFWRHHKDAGNNAKAPSKHAQAKTAPKHEQIASNKGNPSVKRAPATHAAKPAQKAQDSKTDASKQ